VSTWQTCRCCCRPQAVCTRHNYDTVWALSNNRTSAQLTACVWGKPVSFLYYFYSFNFLPCSLPFILRFLLSVPLYYFTFSTCINFLHLSSYFFPSIFLFIGVVSCVISFFISSCLYLLLSSRSFNRSYFHPLLYNLSVFSRFLPLFILLLLFLYFTHSYLYLRGAFT
jgi:hypothetical protein